MLVDLDGAGFARRLVAGASETRDAIITAVLANNRYTVKDAVTEAPYAATGGQPNATYAIGKRVIVRHDASGRATGRPLVIAGYALSTENGAISGTLNVTGGVTAPTFLNMPDKVTLVKGGLPVYMIVYGCGLTSGAVYGGANIFDAVAQSVSSDAIILEPYASASAVAGRYSLTLNGIVLSDFIEVVT